MSMNTHSVLRDKLPQLPGCPGAQLELSAKMQTLLGRSCSVTHSCFNGMSSFLSPARYSSGFECSGLLVAATPAVALLQLGQNKTFGPNDKAQSVMPCQ
jgi:hypothetical protein